MTKIKAPEMWHVYGGPVVLGDGEETNAWMTTIVKPAVPQEMPSSMPANVVVGKTIWNGDKSLPHLASFDHEPTEEELDALQDLFDH